MDRRVRVDRDVLDGQELERLLPEEAYRPDHRDVLRSQDVRQNQDVLPDRQVHQEQSRGVRRANAGENNPSMRRHLDAGPDQRDFAALDEFFGQGATDYFAQLFSFGESGDPSQGTGAIYSFTTDRAGGFDDDDLALLQSTLPALSLR